MSWYVPGEGGGGKKGKDTVREREREGWLSVGAGSSVTEHRQLKPEALDSTPGSTAFLSFSAVCKVFGQ